MFHMSKHQHQIIPTIDVSRETSPHDHIVISSTNMLNFISTLIPVFILLIHLRMIVSRETKMPNPIIISFYFSNSFSHKKRTIEHFPISMHTINLQFHMKHFLLKYTLSNDDYFYSSPLHAS